jgi:hypothetical protein
MKRALLAAALAALATAAPAAAKQAKSLRATASVSPPVQLFGNDVTARVSVIVDSTRVDPARLRVAAKFAPFAPVRPPQEVQTGSGRYVQTTWTWTLRCLAAACVPVAPPSDVSHDFGFPPAQISGFGVNGRSVYRAHVFFPAVEVLSQISPSERAFIVAHKRVQWRYQLAPAAGDAYRLPPGLVFWLAVVLAGLCCAAALVLAGRWALGLRKPAAATAPALPASYLERALALFFWANARGDETLQRKALERVADELPLDVVDLSEIARELAWSPETPEGDEVEAISERAGVLVHPEERADA